MFLATMLYSKEGIDALYDKTSIRSKLLKRQARPSELSNKLTAFHESPNNAKSPSASI